MIPTLPIALTCGEPAGIGPELAVQARLALGDAVPFFWIGDPRHLPAGASFQVIDRADRTVPPRVLPVLSHEFPEVGQPGIATARNAQAVIDVIERAVDLVRAGAASAICTAPIHKKALQDGAGFAFPGHTEFLAHLGGDVPVVMMLASPLLRVVPVTIHIALDQVAGRLTAALLEQTIRLTHRGLADSFAIAQPRIAVAGLNPHAGEGGAMGRQEITLITPVLERLRSEGMLLLGPLSADTMFHARARAGYDAAVCMYHDQALIPIKTLDFDGGVNVTLGLPFIRTSPDHGTGFDIAGKGVARPDSLIAALRMAHDMAKGRAPWQA
ncbi:MAG: 4-hydroxythreonine-4-phosphate dehydrogenase PdxA [bacterium]